MPAPSPGLCAGRGARLWGNRRLQRVQGCAQRPNTHPRSGGGGGRYRHSCSLPWRRRHCNVHARRQGRRPVARGGSPSCGVGGDTHRRVQVGPVFQGPRADPVVTRGVGGRASITAAWAGSTGLPRSPWKGTGSRSTVMQSRRLTLAHRRFQDSTDGASAAAATDRHSVFLSFGRHYPQPLMFAIQGSSGYASVTTDSCLISARPSTAPFLFSKFLSRLRRDNSSLSLPFARTRHHDRAPSLGHQDSLPPSSYAALIPHHNSAPPSLNPSPRHPSIHAYPTGS